MGAKSEYFVLTLPLRTEKWQADILDRRLRVNRDIYNAMLKKAYGRYLQMTQTKAWRKIEEGLRENSLPTQAGSGNRNDGTDRIFLNPGRDSVEVSPSLDIPAAGENAKTDTAAARRKDLYRQRDALVEKYRLRKYDLTKDAARYRQAFKENTDSPICQNLAENVWKAIDRLVTGKGRQVHFKGLHGLNDLTGKTNKSSILYRDGIVKWKGLYLKAVSKDNAYEREALQHEIRYCRIKRREIRGKFRYYVDLVLEGCAPLKHPENLGVQGDVSLRLYPERRERWRLGVTDSRIAAPDQGSDPAGLSRWQSDPVGPTVRKLNANALSSLKLNPAGFQDRKIEREKQEVLQFLYRSRKAMNPQNHTEDGKIRAGAFEWTYSKHYIRERSHYRELCRRQRERRRQYQCCLADGLLAEGNCFYIEELDLSRMKRRVSHTGPGRPRRYGRSVEMSAPGSFLEILKRKCAQYGKRYESYRVEDTQIDIQEVQLA